MQNDEARLCGHGASEEGLRIWEQLQTEASQGPMIRSSDVLREEARVRGSIQADLSLRLWLCSFLAVCLLKAGKKMIHMQTSRCLNSMGTHYSRAVVII